MKNTNIEEVVNHLKKSYGNSRGCSLEELQEIENKFNVKLPKTYAEFLLHFGKGMDIYMDGDDYTIRWLPFMKDAANKILINQKRPSLKDSTFVFWMHQGYQFCFFDCASEQADNPPVYYYNECYEELGIIKITDTLTDFLYNPEILNEVLNEKLKRQ